MFDFGKLDLLCLSNMSGTAVSSSMVVTPNQGLNDDGPESSTGSPRVAAGCKMLSLDHEFPRYESYLLGCSVGSS